MYISEFIKQYNESKQKNACVKKHIKQEYIPYETKISLAQKIVDVSMYKDVNGKKTFVLNSPLRYMLFIQAIVDYYTDLEWDKDGDQLKISEDFNLIEANGITETIIAAIGDDVTRFTTILNMVVDDTTDIHRSMVPFFETKLEAVSLALNSITQAFDDPAIKDKITNFIGESNNGVSEVQSEP